MNALKGVHRIACDESKVLTAVGGSGMVALSEGGGADVAIYSMRGALDSLSDMDDSSSSSSSDNELDIEPASRRRSSPNDTLTDSSSSMYFSRRGDDDDGGDEEEEEEEKIAVDSMLTLARRRRKSTLPQKAPAVPPIRRVGVLQTTSGGRITCLGWGAAPLLTRPSSLGSSMLVAGDSRGVVGAWSSVESVFNEGGGGGQGNSVVVKSRSGRKKGFSSAALGGPGAQATVLLDAGPCVGFGVPGQTLPSARISAVSLASGGDRGRRAGRFGALRNNLLFVGQLTDGSSVPPVTRFAHSGGTVRALDFQCDGDARLVACAVEDSREIVCWDLRQGPDAASPAVTLSASSGAASAISFSPWQSNWLAVGGADGSCSVWDLRKPSGAALVQRFVDHWQPCTAVSWSPTHASHLMTAGADGAVRLWSLGRDPGYGSTATAAFRWARPFRGHPLVGAGFAADDRPLAWACTESGLLACATFRPRFLVHCASLPAPGASGASVAAVPSSAAEGSIEKLFSAAAAPPARLPRAPSSSRARRSPRGSSIGGTGGGGGATPATPWYESERVRVFRLVQGRQCKEAFACALGLARRVLSMPTSEPAAVASSSKRSRSRGGGSGSPSALLSAAALHAAMDALNWVHPFEPTEAGGTGVSDLVQSYVYRIPARLLRLSAAEAEGRKSAEFACELLMAAIVPPHSSARVEALLFDRPVDLVQSVPVSVLSATLCCLRPRSAAAGLCIRLFPLLQQATRWRATFLPLVVDLLRPTVFDSSAVSASELLAPAARTGATTGPGGGRTATESSLSAAREAFDAFDTDGSKSIDMNEFRLLCVALGFGQSDNPNDPVLQDDLITESFQTIDADNSGEIDFDEFAAWWAADSESAFEATAGSTTVGDGGGDMGTAVCDVADEAIRLLLESAAGGGEGHEEEETVGELVAAPTLVPAHSKRKKKGSAAKKAVGALSPTKKGSTAGAAGAPSAADEIVSASARELIRWLEQGDGTGAVEQLKLLADPKATVAVGDGGDGDGDLVSLCANRALTHLGRALADERWADFYLPSFALIKLTERRPLHEVLCAQVVDSFALVDRALGDRVVELKRQLNAGDQGTQGLSRSLARTVEPVAHVARVLEQAMALPPALFKVLVNRLDQLRGHWASVLQVNVEPEIRSVCRLALTGIQAAIVKSEPSVPQVQKFIEFLKKNVD